ncbi:MAG: hypothetical protein K1X85_05825 [Ignavibacteria bacterium]|nr:hypothetical protein [Ignavibacteria bacterium]
MTRGGADLNSGRSFFGSVLAVSAAFLITRLPYFMHYPVIVLSSDSASYIAAAFQLMELKAPLFDIRTPGYPLFIAAVWSLGKNFIAISLVQSVITYLSAVFFLAVAYRYYGRTVIWFAVAVCGFITSGYFLVLEMSMLTEGIFTSIVLFASGVLMMSVKSGKPWAWAVFSALTGLLICIRPAGLFLIGLILPLAFYFYLNKTGVRSYLAVIAPCALILLALCTYNLSTLGKFTITPFGEANLAGVTVLFMGPSEKYPENVNNAIRSTLDSIPRRDLNYVRNSYNPDRLFNTFKDHFHMQMMLVDNLKRSDSTMTYIKAQPYLRQISLDAISTHPEIYAKFFLCNLYYFFTNIGRNMDYFGELGRIYKRSVIDRRFVRELEDGKWRQVSGDAGLNASVKDFVKIKFDEQEQLDGFIRNSDGSVTLKPTLLMSIAGAYLSLSAVVFRNPLWLLLFAAMIYYSLRVLAVSKFRDSDAVLSAMFALIFILKALLVSSVESSLERYSYTVELSVYLSLPFILILRKKLIEYKSQNKLKT